MFRVNKKLEYGIIALLYLASREDRAASVREMAEACHLPETLLSKIMQTMKAKGFVAAIHGNQGGYRLNQNLADISLLGLNHALVGPLQVAECLEPGNRQCPVGNRCAIASPMQLLNQRIIQLFETTSVESLAARKVAL